MGTWVKNIVSVVLAVPRNRDAATRIKPSWWSIYGDRRLRSSPVAFQPQCQRFQLGGNFQKVRDGLRVGEAPRDSTTAFGVAAESIGIVVHVTDVDVSASA